MNPNISIICPTYCHAQLLRMAVRGVLRQTISSWELFIIGDGVDEATREIILELLGWDNRIHFIDKPKSQRHGEPYRHEVLTHLAKGAYVFYLGDDDLWMPNHLESMLHYLDSHDVVHSKHAKVSTSGTITSNFVNWSDPIAAFWTLGPPRKNGVGLSQVAHRMDFYKTLPWGWRTTPTGQWSDHYMWKQMLSQPNVKAGCSMQATALQFPSPQREGMTLQERYEEMQEWDQNMIQHLQELRTRIQTEIESDDRDRPYQLDRRVRNLDSQRILVAEQLKIAESQLLQQQADTLQLQQSPHIQDSRNRELQHQLNTLQKTLQSTQTSFQNQLQSFCDFTPDLRQPLENLSSFSATEDLRQRIQALSDAFTQAQTKMASYREEKQALKNKVDSQKHLFNQMEQKYRTIPKPIRLICEWIFRQ